MNSSHDQLVIDMAFHQDVVDGLSRAWKSLPSKYLYDERGSRLFDEICELEEYYLSRAESQIMQSHADSIASQIGEGVMLVEYGSGSSIKTRILLDSLQDPVAYVPVDISREHVMRTAEELRIAYPAIEILPVIADFTEPFALPPSSTEPSHVALYFPGSTIGNFTPKEAGKLLQHMARMLGVQGGLLIGIDLQKEVSVVQSAYADAKGTTAKFSLNLLERINSELGADFDISQFQHQARYNGALHRIEISIVSQCEQIVTIGDHEYSFSHGEEILTEYSHKYNISGFAKFAKQYGFSLHRSWTDDDEQFAILHLVLE